MCLSQGEILDDTAVKKLVLNFEKKALKNREMRIKFPDQPEKFMDSELDLHEALQVPIDKLISMTLIHRLRTIYIVFSCS